MRKAILYVGNFGFPDGNAAAQRARANARLFADAGYHVVCVGCSSSVSHGEPQHLAAADEPGIEYWNISLPANTREWFRKITSIAELEFFFARLGQDLGLVIAYDFPAVALLRLRRRVHRAGAKLLAESTEWYTALPSASQRSPSALGLTAIEVTHQASGARPADTEPGLSVNAWPPSVET